jgi:Ca2+-binding RTX toxin-like protein
MAANSAQEQLMLELVNRARMNPAAEATRFGISLNKDLAPGTITATPKQVLAMNDFLVLSADRHSNWMIVNDRFDHVESPAFPNGRTGLNPGDRMTAAGYALVPPFSAGENISWTGTTGTIDLTTSIIAQHRGLFLSAGHRENMLNDTFREVGIGQQTGQFLSGGVNYNSSMVTQNFALSGNKVFVTGVVYNDTIVNDNFFTVGEQTPLRAVGGTGGVSDTTGAGGGYELGFSTTGAKTIGFNLATGLLQVAVTVATKNIKIDAVNGHEIWTNSHLSVVGGPITELHALGMLAIALTGGAASEKLFGNAAANRLTARNGNDFLDGGGGPDRMLGEAGNDTYRVDHAGDTVDETGGTGADTVQSSITFNLSDTVHAIGLVEYLTLLGNAPINGSGNAQNNLMIGNSAANVLAGGGGNDTLIGGPGVDTLGGGPGDDNFVLNAPLAGRDVIAGFSNLAGDNDTFRLENGVMPALGGPGALNPALFFAGAAAHDPTDRVVYNQSTGALDYDSNGNAAGGVTHIALLSTRPVLTIADFVVI